MELKDVKIILKRIQINYPSFINDTYVQSEWYKELKDYDIEDVMKKLEEHMRSSEYGNSIPKLYFLTKYLKTAKEKQNIEHYELQCPICEKFINEEKYDKHFERCIDVEYIINKRKELFNEDTSEELKIKYLEMNDELFDNKYVEFLDKIYNKISEDEQKRLDNIIKKYLRRNE